MIIAQINGLEESGRFCKVNPDRKMGESGGYYSYEFCVENSINSNGNSNCTFYNNKSYDYALYHNRRGYNVYQNDINKIGDFGV